MLGFAFRLLWRLLVGVLAIALAYATFFIVYPYLNETVPFLVAIIVTYLALAYVGIPTVIRVFRLVIKPNHIPVYVTTADGWASDPVNIAIAAKDRRHLVRSMKDAGWHTADKITIRSSYQLAVAMILGRSYPTAPFSNLYLFGRAHDIGFQIESSTPPSPRHRHHVRFWLLTPPDTSRHDSSFWHRILKVFKRRNRQIWIGAATHDISMFGIRSRNLQITHRIDSETDKERNFLIASLTSKGSVRRTSVIEAGEPISFKGQSPRSNIVTDGRITLVELKRS